MDEQQLKDIITEIDDLVSKVTSGGEEPSSELLDSLEEVTQELSLLKEKKQLQSSRDLLTKLDTLIKTTSDGDNLSTENIKSIVEAVKQIKVETPQVNVEPPKVEVNVPEVKVPQINVPAPVIPEPKVYFPDEMKIVKPSWIEGLFNIDPVIGAINGLKDLLAGFRFPTDPKDAIPVRLSNGEKFYNAIGGMASAITGAFPFKKSDSTDQAALVDGDGKQYTYIQEVEPTAQTKINATVELGKNSSGDLVRIRKTIAGVTYEKTLSNIDMNVTTTQTISSWSSI